MNTELCSNIIFLKYFLKQQNFSELQKKPRAEFDLKKKQVDILLGERFLPRKLPGIVRKLSQNIG